MNRDPRTIGNHLYVAVLLPFDRQMKVDDAAYRDFLQHFIRSPMPKPLQHEIDALYQLLKNLGLPVIGSKEIRLAACPGVRIE